MVSNNEKITPHSLGGLYGTQTPGITLRKLNLTPAVTLHDQGVFLKQGYARSRHYDESKGSFLPVLEIAVHSENLIDVFVTLTNKLAEELKEEEEYSSVSEYLTLIFESSHLTQEGHEDWLAIITDPIVLESQIYQFEDLLLKDGKTGISVCSFSTKNEVHLSEDKIIYVFGKDLEGFESLLEENGIERDDKMYFLNEHAHSNNSKPDYHAKFLELVQDADAEKVVES